jgi:hypothetical protein
MKRCFVLCMVLILALLLLALSIGCQQPSRIAFISNRDGHIDIYLMDPDGSNQTRLTNNPADDYFPAWSP